MTTHEPSPDTTVLVSGRVTPADLDSLPRLQTVVIPFAGLIPATRDALLPRSDLQVYNLHHNADATAEKAIELLFAVAKGTVSNHHEMTDGSWAPRFEGSRALQLSGRSVVVLGYGAIGQRVARACRALGMTVQAVRRTPDADPAVASMDQFADFCRGAQVLMCCAPLTPETEGIVDHSVIASLSPDAVVVNVGRGALIDEKALFDALASKSIYGAGLDVWWQYPHSSEDKVSPGHHPFHELENVVMSPHIGGTVTDTEPARLRALADLLNSIFNGDTSVSPVDVIAGY